MSEPTVFIVDDDEAVRDATGLLLRSVGLPVATYATGQAFLDRIRPEQPGCVVLDVRMPSMSGLELLQRMKERHLPLPVIMLTGHGDVPMAVEAMKLGALDFMQKPFRDQELLDCIQKALQLDARQRRDLAERDLIRQRLQTLTAREYEVLEHMLEGKANKVIALELDLSQRTVEIHRSRVMDKMQARSLAILVQLVLQCRD
ncbi:MAG: response regulator transcription factor [Candidatus Competibacterales bacterium]|nr:response regulator transcription factor [Candidatus Competibacterales bacterium]